MTLKIAWLNVRRSARDYAIYFLTLALGVAMFYAFNALSEQSIMFDALNAESQRMLDLLGAVMGLFSGAIAFVLAFLVVYANRFLLKRRKREFGMYLMLGMSAGRVARILLAETALVGAVSLVVGLLMGVAASQGMSFVTAALMGTTMSKYQFIVSGRAILLTLACFAGIFVLSALVDVVYVSRRKLADLISAHEASEKQISRNPVVSCVIFALSLIVLGIAYWQLTLNGLQVIDEHFIAATVLMIVGTVLFFWSVMNVVLLVVQRSKSLRFRGLAMFTTRQISSKVNTAFASTAVVCVMLFFALTTVSGGLAMVELFTGNLEECTRYDATVDSVMSVGGYTRELSPDEYTEKYKGMYGKAYERMIDADYDSVGYLAARSKTWNSLVKGAAQLDYFLADVTYGELLDTRGDDVERTELETADMRDTKVKVVSVDQVNRALALIGAEQITLGETEFLVNNTVDGADPIMESLAERGACLTLFGKKLTCAKRTMTQPMRTCAMTDVALEIVVPSWVTDKYYAAKIAPYSSCVDVMYGCDRAEGDGLLLDALSEAIGVSRDELENGVVQLDSWPLASAYTGTEMTEQASGLRMVITYLAVYIGLILMLTTAAVLAIQQLSEVADSLPRYRRLSTLGADERAIVGSLRWQTLVYFLAPLGLALCHSACALWVLSGAFLAELGVNIASAAAISLVSLLVLYGCYFLVAYATSRSMVRRG